MRMALVIAVVAGVLIVGGGCKSDGPNVRPTEPSGRSGVTMKITPSKLEYARGEQITLAIELTNGERTTCHVSQIPEGTIAFVSLTHNGDAVAPMLVNGSYINGFASYLRGNLAPLAPGRSITLPMRSDRNGAVENRQALETSTVDVLDEAALAFWPVDAPGEYRLSARYVLPPLPDAPANVCFASGEPARAEFTVRGE